MKKELTEFIERQSTRKIVFLCFLLLLLFYLLPTFIQPEYDSNLHIKKFYLGFPGVLSGDEPHYFIVTTSIINDKDFYLENNYNLAYHYGGCDLGFRYINTSNPTIGPHIQFVDSTNRIAIPTLENKTLEENIQWAYSHYNVTSFRWVSNRPIGLPFFSSLFLWPLKDTCFIEYGAIYLSVLLSYVSLIFFYYICLFYVARWRSEAEHETKLKNNKRRDIFLALFFTCIFSLSTQYWHYSKTYFTEPYIASFLLMSYYLFFIKKNSFVPGVLLSFGFMMKSPFGMYLVLFWLFLLFKREWKRMLLFMLGGTPLFLGTFYYNWFLSGNIFYSAQAGHLLFGNYLEGILLWLLSPTSGLLPFAPFLIFSVLGFWNLWKKDKETVVSLSLIIFPYFFFWTSYILTQNGSGGYSSRYLVPLLGFLTLLTLSWYIDNKNKALQIFFFSLIAISFFINLQAAFLYPLFWDNPPWQLYDLLIHKIPRIIEVLKQTL